MKYEVIIFDADETLFDFKKAEKKAFFNLMKEFNADNEKNYHFKIYKDINTAIWKECEEGLISQKSLKIERFRRFAEAINLNIDAEILAKAYMQHLSNGSFLFTGAEALITELKQRCRLSIITNGLTDVQNKRIKKSIIAHHFEDIIISEDVKVSKPDPKIFELCLSNLNHKDKSKVLIVGDNLTSDIQGGINFGIDTCWYNPKKSSNNKCITPTYEISSFDELKLLLLSNNL